MATFLRWAPGLFLAPLLAFTLADAAGRGFDVRVDVRIDVRIASQQAQPPKWIHGGDKVRGICPEIMAAVERVEPRLHFREQGSRSLPGIEAGLEGGSLDAACALVTSPRRNAIALAVGKSVYMTRHRLAVRAGDPVTVDSVADLVRLDALVTSQRGSVLTDQLKARGVHIDDATDDNEVNLRKLLAGHGRFTYMNDLTLRYLVQSAHLGQQVRILPLALAEAPAYFWVSRKADPALAPLLGAAIDKLKASGELDRIHLRWSAGP